MDIFHFLLHCFLYSIRSKSSKRTEFTKMLSNILEAKICLGFISYTTESLPKSCEHIHKLNIEFIFQSFHQSCESDRSRNKLNSVDDFKIDW